MSIGVREAFMSFTEDLTESASSSKEATANSLALIEAAHKLAGDTPPSTSGIRTCLNGLVGHAHSAMASSLPQETSEWRCIYTDGCILLAYVDVLDFWRSGNAAYVFAAIAHLDHAIVIAGAAGDGRLDLIIDLIEAIQSECLHFTAADYAPHSAASPLHEPRTVRQSFPTAGKKVSFLDDPPSLATFASRLSREPFVLSGYLEDWPALNDHPWRSLDYLRSVAGPGRVVPVEVGSDYRNDDWSQRMMSWDDFLDSLGATPPNEPRQMLYLAQHNLFKQFPALQRDIILPDYAYSAMNPPDNYSQYAPPRNEEQMVLNAWLGATGTFSPAHTDPFFNLYGIFVLVHASDRTLTSFSAQVVGRKTIWLAPPEASPYMYSYAEPSHSRNEDQPRNPAANHDSPSMSNTTRVDVLLPPSSTEEISRSRSKFPAFWEKVVPHAMCVTLEPGDLLFFPPGWWHAMRSEETSFSVSIWF
ncbi:Clavaminate synthase-like protein [Trametes gibbosa]|nr:Clavaminate synthase-like protein [Trametes gibbosa]